MSRFKTIDEAVEAVDGTVSLAITEWDDGFTWGITVTTNKLTGSEGYEQFEYEWDEDDGACKTYTEAGIAACEIAIDSMAQEAEDVPD